MTTIPQLTLSHATGPAAEEVTMPTLGYGTYKVAPDVAAARVTDALHAGYRHIDTAQMYGNEEAVGAAITRFLAETGTSRRDIFLTSKLDNPHHAPDDARREIATSLEKLGVDHVDLFLIHWPLPRHGVYVDTWRVLLEMLEAGTARAVGVSNFEIEHIERLEAETGVLPAVNQIEAHPFFANREVRAWCRDRGIAVENWSPLGRGQVLADPVVAEVAAEAGCTPAQAILAWHLASGAVVIPKASSAERIQENFGAASVHLTDEQLARIDALDRGEDGRIGSHPNDKT